MTLACVSAHREGAVLLVHCQPGAKVSKIIGLHDERLKIALNAPALENRANEALIDWLAKVLDCKRTQLELLSGQTSRKKRLLIRNFDCRQLCLKLMVFVN